MVFDPVIVSATAGPLPETVDQIAALRSQGATSVDVVITDNALVDAELLELVELEVRDLIEKSGAAVGSITRASGSSDASVPYGP